jgi:predicted transcriptional regulator of viral defense system
MKLQQFDKIDKLFFGVEDIANLLRINKNSAKVLAHRYYKFGFLLRLKNDYYILKSRFNYLEKEEYYFLANYLQVPSYISLMTALNYYNITTQEPKNYFESVAVKRTKNIQVSGSVFSFQRIQEKYYTGFILNNNFYIAEKEKAMFDIIYLTALQKYSFDPYSIDFKKLDKKILEGYILNSNRSTINLWRNLCVTFRI